MRDTATAGLYPENLDDYPLTIYGFLRHSPIDSTKFPIHNYQWSNINIDLRFHWNRNNFCLGQWWQLLWGKSSEFLAKILGQKVYEANVFMFKLPISIHATL